MPRDIPTATYRVQLTHQFTFDDAAALVPYLKSLGISHLYASPFLKARAGSMHGYDIVDHNVLNPELGGEEGFARLSAALADADIGLILDFVPNHMVVNRADNAWWLDVLEWGQKSPYADYFDIDWETLPYKPEGGVLLPILGHPYGDVLEAGEIELKFDPDEGSFSAWYFEHRLPIRPNRYGDILRTVVARAEGDNDPSGRRLLDIAERYPDPRAPSRNDAPALKQALAMSEGAALIERGLDAYRPARDNASAVVALHRLLERQPYRVAHWRTASSEINYRRFFDVNDLAGLRVENPKTFVDIHRLVVELIATNRLHGLRIDHIDGLHDPHQYCRRLQRIVRRARGKAARRPFYTVVEKILGEGEALPPFAGIAGTTGYEWLNVISRVLIDDRGIPALRDTAHQLTGRDKPYDEILEDAKHRVLDTMLTSEFTVLVRLLARIAAGHWRSRDFTLDGLRAALEAFVVQFPVYRTYVTGDGCSAHDRATIEEAVEKARARWFAPGREIFDFLKDVLTLDLIGPDRQGYSRSRVKRFAMKVQQFTGPMMAKSLEDTTFYRDISVLALNEVGGDPIASALSIPQFHDMMMERLRTAPHGMTATATHDTKRGEDARARLLALSEMPQEWAQAVAAWRTLNEDLLVQVKDRGGTRRAPSRTHEYLLYQTIVAALPTGGLTPDFAERMAAYAVKAAREGKLETSWMNPNVAYEDALQRFAKQILDPTRSATFLESVNAFTRRVAVLGALNGMSQLTLKAMMPGVPDFYQGAEFWDLSLVDPDNRRQPDFAARIEALEEVGLSPAWATLAAVWDDGHLKRAWTRALLALRSALPHVFAHGGYQPLEVRGRDRDHLIAFARTDDAHVVVVIAGRHFGSLTDGGRRWLQAEDWDAELVLDGFEEIEWRALDNESTFRSAATMTASSLLGAFPAAVLVGQKARMRDRKSRRAPA
ncbi:MAG: malto-oligosyltrehalose synthase [Rhizobiales bacterium]|nr:malto-oligosyltrehalose synthase [Hyphomicrobiales bacterium]